MTVIPILAVPEVAASPAAMAYLLAVAAAFSLPAGFSNWRKLKTFAIARRGSRTLFRSWVFLVLALVFPAVSIACSLMNIQIQGFTLIETITKPIETACRFLEVRYRGDIVPSIFAQMSIVSNYAAAPIVGIVCASTPKWRVRVPVYVIAFVPSLIALAVYADKGTIFQFSAYFLGGAVVARLAAGRTALLTWQTIFAAVATAMVLVPMVALSMLNRADGDCSDTSRTQTISSVFLGTTENQVSTEELAQQVADQRVEASGEGMRFYMRSYAFSHAFAFSDWFDHYLRGDDRPYFVESGPTWGFWTFLAIGEILLPEKPVPEGYYAEYFEVPGVIKSNIYTMFRGLINDFGIAGSILIMGLLGWISNWAYGRLLVRESAPLAQTIYIALAGVIYSSYLLSIGTWASIYAASILTFAILWLGRLVRRQPQ